MKSTNFEKISKFEVKLETSLAKNRFLKSNKKKKKRKQEIDHTKIENYLQQLVYDELFKNNMVPTGIPTYKLDNKCNLTYQTKVNLVTPIESIDHLKVTKPTIEVTQKMIDAYIDEIRRDATNYSVSKENRVAIETDFVNLEIEIADDCKINQSVILNKPFEISELPKTVVGMKQSETKTISTQLPNTLKYKKYAGKKESIKITVKQILTYKLPTMDDTFSKSLGFNDVVHHIVNTISEIQSGQNKSNYKKIEDDICSQLLEKHPVEISNEAILEFKVRLENKLKSELTTLKWSKEEIDEYMENQSDNIIDQTKREITQNSLVAMLVAYFKKNHNMGNGYNFANLASQNSNFIIKSKIIEQLISANG